MNGVNGYLNRVKRSSGFTLVEIMLVIAIIGTLANFAVPALSKQVVKSRLSELVSEIGDFRTQYEVIHQSGDIDVFGIRGYPMHLMPDELRSYGLHSLEYPGLNFSVVPHAASQGAVLGLLIVDKEGTNIEVLSEMLPSNMIAHSGRGLLSVILFREDR